MNDNWKNHVAAAHTDLTAATDGKEALALGHLQDARDSINRAIDALIEAMEGGE